MKPADCLWISPESGPILSSQDIHVWRASVDQPESSLERLAETLSPDEQSRAERFHFEQHRRRFIAGRGILRTILSHYAGVEPSHLHFRYGPQGKPALSHAAGPGPLHFNLAHSQGLAIYAFSRQPEIGIDLEWIRPMSRLEQIAGRFFSARENASFQTLPAHRKLEAFFTCWTRKEAYIKARGEGLAFPLDQFDVSLLPGEPARLLDLRGAEPQEVSRWLLMDLVPASGYAAALAARGRGWHLGLWQWS